MNFEIAPREYHELLTWNETRLYLFTLTIDGKTDWRLPNSSEYHNMCGLYLGWVQEDAESWQRADIDDTFEFWCYPIRDLKDV